MAVVVTIAKGYDLAYIWKDQEPTTGGYYINAAQAGEPCQWTRGNPSRRTSPIRSRTVTKLGHLAIRLRSALCRTP